MAKPGRRFLASSALFLLFMLMGGAHLQAPAPLVRALGAEAFTATTPAKLYTGVPSHVGLADADPTGGTNGYCVAVANEGHASLGANNGFSVTNGTILSTAVFLNGSVTTTDDVYCAVVQGTPQSAMPRPPMTIHWTYLDDVPVNVDLEVALVTVTLKGADGVIGGVARVCTEGWDPTFLTGETSNTPPAPPNPRDVVKTTDWSTVPGTPTVEIVGVVRAGREWCVNIAAPAPAADIEVSFAFYAVYDVNTELDDVLVAGAGHVPEPAVVLDPALVTIDFPDKPELRHITPVQGPDSGGQIVADQVANPNVVGADHTACVIPSVPTDTLLPDDIRFDSSDGAGVSSLEVFNNPASFPNLPGVEPGTVCFTWTSTTPGRQTVTLQFTASTANPANVSGSPQVLNINWDTNHDGNDVPGGGFGAALVKLWDTIDHTVITTGGDIEKDIVTNGSISVPVQYNVADNTLLAGNGISLSEWVVGVRKTPKGPVFEPLDGVRITLRITSNCGYFGDIVGTKVLTGPEVVTVDGRYQFKVEVVHDPGCTPNDTIHVVVEAAYPPGAHRGGRVETETVDITFDFNPGVVSPIVAWVGQTVTIQYAFSGANCPDSVASFSREDGEPGGFVAGDSPIHVGASHATADFLNCVATIGYESEVPGEADIVAILGNNPFSRVLYTVIFLEIEDVTISTNEELIISSLGHLEANIRGWFKNANPSGRDAETKGDRRLPADRWILPDDWATLRGPADFHVDWPATAPLPPAQVTFFMENEGTLNNFHTGVNDGAAGVLLPDTGTEFGYNVVPETGVESILGRVDRPRILSDGTEPSGKTSIATFGDFNASYEGCGLNAPTGNPFCAPGDLAGHTRYYATAEYPGMRGKQVSVRSNTVSTRWFWAGYKQLSVVDTADPSIKYVVAHLRDRDGYCDAASYNNVLGVPVEFQIDAGEGGVIIGAQARPSSINILGRSASTTTFDTKDEQGEPLNTDIALPVVEDDECQAWIKVSNSLLEPVNVLVTLPAPPSPVPANVRMTAFSCGLAGSVTLTNLDDHLVSLAGFSLRSRPPGNFSIEEEYLGLIGFLEPGQSRTWTGDPEKWLNATGRPVFGDTAGDYGRLVWNGFELSFAACGGTIVNALVPDVFPLDGEGEIQLDITIPFGAEAQVPLSAGWNLVTVGGGSLPLEKALGGSSGALDSVYTWDAETETWGRYIAGAPAYLNSIDSLESGRAYWVFAKEPFTLTVPR